MLGSIHLMEVRPVKTPGPLPVLTPRDAYEHSSTIKLHQNAGCMVCRRNVPV